MQQISTVILLALVAAVSAGFYEHEDYNHHPEYKFEYSVHDPHTHDIKSQHETRHGDVVKGFYKLKEADGTIREVHYTADHKNGFNAKIHRSGKAKHPEHYKSSSETFYGHGGHSDGGHSDGGHSDGGFGDGGHSDGGHSDGGFGDGGHSDGGHSDGGFGDGGHSDGGFGHEGYGHEEYGHGGYGHASSTNNFNLYNHGSDGYSSGGYEHGHGQAYSTNNNNLYSHGHSSGDYGSSDDYGHGGHASSSAYFKLH